jgi:hypothetical protein
MVRQGHAIASWRYAEDYAKAELTAKALPQGSEGSRLEGGARLTRALGSTFRVCPD